MDSISVRVEHKGMDKSRFQMLHDTRTGNQPDYVDRARAHLNDVLIVPGSPGAMSKLCKKRRELRVTQRQMKIDASVATIGIVTFSTSAQKIINDLSRDEQNFMFEDVSNAISKRLNNEITGLVVHRDESAIHAHFQMPAYSLDGTPVSKLITPRVASELQDIAGACVEQHGISRGVKKKVRVARGESLAKTTHRNVKQLHEDLPAELETLQRQIEEQLLKLQKNDRLIREKQLQIDTLDATVEKTEQAKKTLAIYEKRIFDASVELENLTYALEEKSGGVPFKKLDAPDFY